MLYRFRAQNELTAAQQQLSRTTTIDLESPGPILRDFQTLLDFIEESAPQLTTTQLLPLRALEPLNARLSRPLQHGLTRPQQKSFPHINGLYWLVRASGLTRVDTTGSKPRLLVDAEARAVWETLNLTERYCALLETWMFRAAPEIIGERGSFGSNNVIRACTDLFDSIPDEGLTVDADKEQTLMYTPGAPNLALLELFGLLVVQPAPVMPGKGWRAAWLRSTGLGDALLALMVTALFAEPDDEGTSLLYVQPHNIPVGVLQPTLRPYFPAWQHNLVLPTPEFRDGLFVFTVALDKNLWRRIAIPAQAKLDELSSAILNAYRFDFDHLYRFLYRNRYGSEQEVNHPELDAPPWADEVCVGDLPLQVGESMIYNYDFGDNWRFVVTLERIDPPDPKRKSAKLLEKQGRAPEQYG